MRVGIDFGTSNTSVAYRTTDQIRLVALEGTSTSIPTAIFYDESTDSFLLGNSALAAYEAGHDGRLMRSIKSLLGTSLIDESTQVGNRRVPLKSIVTHFLYGVIKRVENATGETVTSVTQGRPVSFNDTDPERDERAQDILQECLEDVGVETVEFLEEPVAAAKSVTFSPKEENLILVVDIGGGTSDFSVIRASKTIDSFEVLSSSGVYVGGNELDKFLSFSDIAQLFGKGEVLEKNKLAAPNEPYSILSDWKLLHRMQSREISSKIDWMRMQSPNSAGIKALRYLVDHHDAHMYANKVEAIKVELSSRDCSTFQYKMEDKILEKIVLRAQFENLIGRPLSKMENALDACLTAANVLESHITDIVLVGGSTLVPIVEQRLTSRFLQAKVVSNDRFTSVAKGLAAHMS